LTALFTELAFYWTSYVDIDPYIRALAGLVDELGVDLVCPTHRLLIADAPNTLSAVEVGLRAGSRSEGRITAARAGR